MLCVTSYFDAGLVRMQPNIQAPAYGIHAVFPGGKGDNLKKHAIINW